jgi:hypothetical protein
VKPSSFAVLFLFFTRMCYLLVSQVVLAKRDEAGCPFQLASLIEKYQATILQATPATWRMLVASEWGGQKGLKALCGGEPLPEMLKVCGTVARLLLLCRGPVSPAAQLGDTHCRTVYPLGSPSLLPSCYLAFFLLTLVVLGNRILRYAVWFLRASNLCWLFFKVELASRVSELWNVYGPTETTVWSTMACVAKGGKPIVQNVPIGRPIGNTTVIPHPKDCIHRHPLSTIIIHKTDPRLLFHLSVLCCVPNKNDRKHAEQKPNTSGPFSFVYGNLFGSKSVSLFRLPSSRF